MRLSSQALKFFPDFCDFIFLYLFGRCETSVKLLNFLISAKSGLCFGKSAKHTKNMSATLLCYRCRTFHAKEAMRRVATGSGERWRCFKCLEEFGWKPANEQAQARDERSESLIDAILRETYPVKRKPGALGRTLLLSVVLHAALVSLQFGHQGLGLPWLRSTPPDRPAQWASIHVMLLPPLARADVPQAETQTADPRVVQIAGQEATTTPPPSSSIKPTGTTEARLRQSGGVTPSPELHKIQKAASTVRALKEKPKSTTVQKGAKILATDASRSWQTPVAQLASTLEDESGSEFEKNSDNIADRKSVAPSESQARQPDPLVFAESDESIKLADIVEKSDEQPTHSQINKVNQEREQTEARLRAEAEKIARSIEKAEKVEKAAKEERAERAAALQARQEEILRQQVAEQRRQEEALKLAEQARAVARQEALARERAEEQLRIKAERDAELSAKIAATLEAEKKLAAQRLAEQKLAEQAAAAKATQEALDKQRASDLERGRQASQANNAQSAAVQTDARGLNGLSTATKSAEAAGNTSPPPTSRESVNTDPRRKASIVGADPKNVSLAFYGEGWRQKIERIGAVNYPRLYKDRHYDTLRVTVTINSDGTLAGVRIDKSSGQQEMDDAVRRIVEMSAPFAVFPPDLRRSYDQIDITRSWVFEPRPKIKN
jgi:TolA protein